MSTSEVAVQVAPSYGLNQDPEVALHEESTTTLLPSRFNTNSLDFTTPLAHGIWFNKPSCVVAYLVLHVPLMVSHVGKRSRLYPDPSPEAFTTRLASRVLADEADGIPGYTCVSQGQYQLLNSILCLLTGVGTGIGVAVTEMAAMRATATVMDSIENMDISSDDSRFGQL